jgi:hypothetical protein
LSQERDTADNDHFPSHFPSENHLSTPFFPKVMVKTGHLEKLQASNKRK